MTAYIKYSAPPIALSFHKSIVFMLFVLHVRFCGYYKRKRLYYPYTHTNIREFREMISNTRSSYIPICLWMRRQFHIYIYSNVYAEQTTYRVVSARRAFNLPEWFIGIVFVCQTYQFVVVVVSLINTRAIFALTKREPTMRPCTRRELYKEMLDLKNLIFIYERLLFYVLFAVSLRWIYVNI